MTQTARDKLCKKRTEKIKVLESNFADMTAGQRMLVATPMIIDGYIRSIPVGEHRTIRALRNTLAKRYKCDVTCPVSTAIFVRMSADAAIEAIDAGEPLTSVSPFWRLLTSKDKIAKRLTIDPDWIDHRRQLEGLPVTPI